MYSLACEFLCPNNSRFYITSFIHLHLMLEQNQSCLLARQAFFHLSHTHSPLLNSLGIWRYLIVFIFILIMNNVQHRFRSVDACVCTGAHACLHVWRPGVIARCVLYLCPLYFWGKASHWIWGSLFDRIGWLAIVWESLPQQVLGAQVQVAEPNLHRR